MLAMKPGEDPADLARRRDLWLECHGSKLTMWLLGAEYEEAASFHQMDGEYGAAAEDYSKAGRALEGHDDARAAKLMALGCENVDQVEEEGKLGIGIDVYKHHRLVDPV